MITVSLNEIRAQSPCGSGWRKVLASNGGASADMDAQFPITDILQSNNLYDTLWTLRCRPERSNLWRKFAVWAARQVEDQMGDPRSIAALDVAWRHSEGKATDQDLAAAWDAAGDAWDAAGDVQMKKIVQILTAGEWVEGCGFVSAHYTASAAYKTADAMITARAAAQSQENTK